ncbi:hypothetical protein LJK87_17425 [Paenibacillus sp. P25]|nr:hypothetical protein LJK87_17425 [Paenibacillus sp. P25]
MNADNTYSKFGATSTAAQFAGIAVREVKQHIVYSGAGAASVAYQPGDPMDALHRGSITVVCNVGTPTAGGSVYIRIATNAAIPAGVIGGFEARPTARIPFRFQTLNGKPARWMRTRSQK